MLGWMLGGPGGVLASFDYWVTTPTPFLIYAYNTWHLVGKSMFNMKIIGDDEFNYTMQTN